MAQSLYVVAFALLSMYCINVSLKFQIWSVLAKQDLWGLGAESYSNFANSKVQPINNEKLPSAPLAKFLLEMLKNTKDEIK